MQNYNKTQTTSSFTEVKRVGCMLSESKHGNGQHPIESWSSHEKTSIFSSGFPSHVWCLLSLPAAVYQSSGQFLDLPNSNLGWGAKKKPASSASSDSTERMACHNLYIYIYIILQLRNSMKQHVRQNVIRFNVVSWNSANNWGCYVEAHVTNTQETIAIGSGKSAILMGSVYLFIFFLFSILWLNFQEGSNFLNSTSKSLAPMILHGFTTCNASIDTYIMSIYKKHCLHTYVHIYIYTYVYIYIHLYIYIYICMYMGTVYVSICIYIYIYYVSTNIYLHASWKVLSIGLCLLWYHCIQDTSDALWLGASRLNSMLWTSDCVLQNISSIGTSSFWQFIQWVDLRENLQETIDVPMKYAMFL